MLLFRNKKTALKASFNAKYFFWPNGFDKKLHVCKN